MIQMAETLHTLPEDAASLLNLTSRNDNCTDETCLSATSSYNQSYTTMIKLEKYCLPVICILGLIGNSLSTITFLRKPLRNAPCSLYLAARGISDNGFLLSLFLIWTSSTFNLRLSQIKGVCQLIILMTYVCGCVSVWLCVFITTENFLLIHNPYIARRVCCNQISSVCIIILLLLAFGVYNISLWIINEDCSHNPSFSSLTQILVYSDTLLTLVVPTVIIFVLLSMIAYKMIKIIHVRKLHDSAMEQLTLNKQRPKKILPIAKVTKMLFVVSCMFFVLNVPSHVIRLMLLIGSFTKGERTAPAVQATIQVPFQLIYYISFSVNVCIYALFGSNFRKILKKTFCSWKNVTSERYTQTEAINLVRRRSHSINVCVAERNSGAFLTVSKTETLVHSCT
ncbi:C-C chemokine receptor type 1-like [Mercenaria mercenaria]|uniref:C-C chemokine receptor type 1-like n=1 Tax=Mercenaria mercenaria TaxID=6596 RepID=UPI00234E4DBE|nr:C-C chemokine receptor type 1-like [Mercenaria mercenaria]